jgi:hypothetical protein
MDFKIDKDEFWNNNEIVQIEKELNELSVKQPKRSIDSLSISEKQLAIKNQFLSQALFQLEIDRLTAKTHNDSILIQEREVQIIMMAHKLEISSKEIENSKVPLNLKNSK